MMQTQLVETDRAKALELWKKYQTHRSWSTPVDQEIARFARLIAKGKIVVKALASIAAAGLNDKKLPNLAIARADARWCYLTMPRDGSARMDFDQRGGWISSVAASKRFVFPAGTFDGSRGGQHKAMVPHIPPDIRPKRGLQNYHILFEADWTEAPPVDPMLLRRIGGDDLWIVCGAWELSEIERAVLTGKFRQ